MILTRFLQPILLINYPPSPVPIETDVASFVAHSIAKAAELFQDVVYKIFFNLIWIFVAITYYKRYNNS
jgi:hypothetical protein